MALVLGKRLDDWLIAAALAMVAAFCVWFRYLPMVDLPQHYAMVSIMIHHADPTFDFAQRYTFDFLGRPYATVYLLAAGIANVASLGVAMRIVVAICTIAPFAGAWALLVVTGRPRVWLLLAIPFAFGALWHWGFLNFLLGTGLMFAGLALVVVAPRSHARSPRVALGLLGPLLLFTHFHGLAMLLLFAPVFAWAYRDEKRGARGAVVTLAPLAPAALAAAAFVLVTWRQAEGSWARMNPGLGERVQRFPEFLAAGVVDPWPQVWLVAFVAVGAIGIALVGGESWTRRFLAAFALMLGAQVAMYFVLPLNTNTATFVSARHALLCVLCAVPLLPRLTGWHVVATRVACAGVCALALVVSSRHLACFDAEARDFDGVLAAMQPNRRVVPLVFARNGACTPATAFPYLHFAGFYQAARGGELARSFALVWNVPIRYRADYHRYAIRDEVEWRPHLFAVADLEHFDYLLVRGTYVPHFAPELGVHEVAKSGAWALYENPSALPLDLPIR
jgi:hypothetical protein